MNLYITQNLNLANTPFGLKYGEYYILIRVDKASKIYWINKFFMVNLSEDFKSNHIVLNHGLCLSDYYC